jgi:hypothetical protein
VPTYHLLQQPFHYLAYPQQTELPVWVLHPWTKVHKHGPRLYNIPLK